MFILKHFKEVLLIIILLLVLGLYVGGYYYFFYLKDDNSSIEQIEEIPMGQEYDKENIITEPKHIFVEIKGAVTKPGVFEVTEENIINDVIKMAGGFSKSAYTNNLNLSKKLSDEMVIYVFTKTEYEKEQPKIEPVVIYEACECKEEIPVCIEEKQSIIVPEENSQKTDDEESQKEEQNNNLININTASKEELMLLTGIGEAKANSIIEYRTLNGLFKETKDIMNVSGISEKMYEKIQDSITV